GEAVPGFNRSSRDHVKITLICCSVAPDHSTLVGRFPPLPADEELELGNVHLLFLTKQASSIVYAADMAMLFLAANSASKRIVSRKGKRGGGGVRSKWWW
ncbi:hypothetical protein LINPERPRIM_LOCUS21030, partial [Linum perenne]